MEIYIGGKEGAPDILGALVRRASEWWQPSSLPVAARASCHWRRRWPESKPGERWRLSGCCSCCVRKYILVVVVVVVVLIVVVVIVIVVVVVVFFVAVMRG